jgi:hypothetical protein
MGHSMTTNPTPITQSTNQPTDLHALPHEVIHDVPLVNGFSLEVVATASAEHAVVHLVGPEECFTVYCFHNNPGEDDAIDLSWGVPLSELGHLLTKVILAVQS